MVKIEAIIRPERIHAVTEALVNAGCGGFHYQNITGQGKQGGIDVLTSRGGKMARAAVPKTLLVTVVPDEMKDAIVDTIVESAKGPNGGQIGDGKIIISQVADVVRVRTGERGESAI